MTTQMDLVIALVMPVLFLIFLTAGCVGFGSARSEPKKDFLDRPPLEKPTMENIIPTLDDPKIVEAGR